MKQYFKGILTLSILVVCCVSLEGIERRSASEQSTFPQFCQQAAIDDQVFAHFRNRIECKGIVENVVYDLGMAYLNWVENEIPSILTAENFEKFRLNDALGGPLTYDYGLYGIFSPTTLRYIKVGTEIQRMFGDLSGMNIVEIGGGYGGQCKILNDLGGFASYTIIDLPEVNALAKKYLALQGVENVFFIDYDKVTDEKKFDLVISNYAFTEVDRDQQFYYLENIINPSPKGYMILNFISHLFNVPSLNENELLNLFVGEEKKGGLCCLKSL